VASKLYKIPSEQQLNGKWRWRCFHCSPDKSEGAQGEREYESREACENAAGTHALSHLTQDEAR